MNNFLARFSLIFWFAAILFFWLERAVQGLATMPAEHWQIHLCFIIAIIVITNLIFLVQALNLVFSLPVVYFAFIYFKSRAYAVPGDRISAVQMALYFMEIIFFSLIVLWNYNFTEGKGARLKATQGPTLEPPNWNFRKKKRRRA